MHNMTVKPNSPGSRDLRSGSQPSSATSSAHKEPVYCLVWTSSKTGTEVRLVVEMTRLVYSRSEAHNML